MKHFNLEEFAGGKLSVQLNKALEKVTENIQDPNTDAQKVRKINVSISLRPNDERNFVSTTVETKLSLALAYRDDTQVVTLHMEKHYAEDPRVEVEIEEIKNG